MATVQKVAVGACCALVVGGSAVTVPVVKHHASEAPQVAMVTPADLDAAAPKRPRRPHAPAPAAPVVAVDTPPSTASTESARIAVPTKPKTAKSRPKARRVPTARPRRFDDRALYNRAVQAFMRTNPTAEERQAFFAGARKFHASPPGSRARRSALLRLAQQAYTKPVRPAPPKGLKPVPTPVATPVATPVETPTPVPTPVETATPVPTVVETPTPVATPTATPTETASPVATP